MTRRSWRSRAPWLVGVVGVVIAVGIGVLRVLPAFSEDDVADARATLEQERASLAELTCERTALGTAEPADAALFRELVAGERYSECRRLASEEGLFDAVRNEQGHTYAWVLDVGEGEDLPPPIGTPIYYATFPPPGRSARVAAAEAACDGLEDEIARLAATPNLCSAAPDLDDPCRVESEFGPLGLAKAIAVRARRAAREDGAFEALSQLVRGIAVVRDYRRGPVSLISSMLSVAAEGILAAHTVSLLIGDPGLSDEQYGSLRSDLDTIANETIEPNTMWRTERLALSCAAGASESEAVDLLVMAAASVELSWCPPGAGPEACAQAWRDTVEQLDTSPPVTWASVFGPRLTSSMTLRWSRDEWTSSLGTYQWRMLTADRNVRMIGAALAYAAARAATSMCPVTLDTETRTVPWSDDPAEIVFYDGDTYEMQAPPLRVSPSFERSVFYLACPAAHAGWIDEAGQEIPPAEPPVEEEAPETEVP